MKPYIWLSALLLWGACTTSKGPDQEITYQLSTYAALTSGRYEGKVQLADWLQYGNFGIGTIDGLDGEMVILNGVSYQIDSDGHANTLSGNEMVPYCTSTYFDTDSSFRLNGEYTLQQLSDTLKWMLPARDVMYAVKIEGLFKKVQTRSVPKQAKPYPQLEEVIAQQRVFNFEELRGTAVGFYFPGELYPVTSLGVHLHFITDSKDAGGHLLNCISKDVIVSVDKSSKLQIVYPPL